MKQVSMTSHIGRAQHDLKSGKDTRINNASDLAKTERHNNHDYSSNDVKNMESSIDLSFKFMNKQYDENLIEVEHLDLTDKVKELYHREFDAAVNEYNEQQTAKGHKERCIDDYFQSISDNQKQEVAVEGIIQFGDMDDWKELKMEDRIKAEPILLKGLQEIMKIDGFKLAGASLHLNESTPHLHYVCVCVDESKRKTGLSKRINKSKVFTKDVLSQVLQDRVREAMETDVMRVFGWEFDEKRTGRNQDLSKNQLRNDQLLLEKNQLQSQLQCQLQELKKQRIQLQEQQETIAKQQETIKTLEIKRLSLVEQIRELIDAIRPLERLRGILEVIRGFGYDFKMKIREIQHRYHLSDKEQEALNELWEATEDRNIGLDSAIDLAEKIANGKEYGDIDENEEYDR